MDSIFSSKHTYMIDNGFATSSNKFNTSFISFLLRVLCFYPTLYFATSFNFLNIILNKFRHFEQLFSNFNYPLTDNWTRAFVDMLQWVKFREIDLWFISNWKKYNRSDRFLYDYEPNGIFHLVRKQKKNCYCDHIPFHLKGIRNLFLGVCVKVQSSQNSLSTSKWIQSKKFLLTYINYKNCKSIYHRLNDVNCNKLSVININIINIWLINMNIASYKHEY